MSFKKLALMLIGCSFMSALSLDAAIAKVVNTKDYKIKFKLQCLEKTIFGDRYYWTNTRTLNKRDSWQKDYFLHLVTKVKVKKASGGSWKTKRLDGGNASTRWKIEVHGLPLRIDVSKF